VANARLPAKRGAPKGGRRQGVGAAEQPGQDARRTLLQRHPLSHEDKWGTRAAAAAADL
jgi:hypothetical protein